MLFSNFLYIFKQFLSYKFICFIDRLCSVFFCCHFAESRECHFKIAADICLFCFSWLCYQSNKSQSCLIFALPIYTSFIHFR